MRRKGLRRVDKTRRRVLYAGLAAVVLVLLVFFYYHSQVPPEKPIILYVNQGNGVVNESNFGTMLSFASSHGFNTVFFQVYREGTTLFNRSQLSYFVSQTHAEGLTIFFALYFTNSSQPFPSSVFNLGEDGISLDMSGLGVASQEALLQGLSSCSCRTAATTTDMNSPLRPDLLILETYGPGYSSFIRHGIIASVGVFATSSQADYQSEFQYALQNSDGVMVFDYAGLLKSGY